MPCLLRIQMKGIMGVLDSSVRCGIMKKLHKKNRGNQKKSIPEDGQSNFLCSTDELPGCPPSGINPNEVPTEIALDILAKILVRIFLKQQNVSQKRTRKP